MTPTTASRTLAVLDTNVLLDLFSAHDTLDLYESRGASVVDEPEALFRRARVRESLLLAMYLHNVGATTYSLHSEGFEIIQKRVPPNSNDMKVDYTTKFLYFVRDHVLPGWTPQIPDPPDGKTKEQADDELLAFAKTHGLTLITNEGYTPAGITMGGPKCLRRKGVAQGVTVCTPKEFLAGKINETAEIAAFLARFRNEAPEFIADQPDREATGRSLTWIFGYYQHVLLGLTEGRTAPVPVSIPLVRRSHRVRIANGVDPNRHPVHIRRQLGSNRLGHRLHVDLEVVGACVVSQDGDPAKPRLNHELRAQLVLRFAGLFEVDHGGSKKPGCYSLVDAHHPRGTNRRFVRSGIL